MKIKGKCQFINNQVYIDIGNEQVNLFCYLASHGLKDKDVKIIVEKEVE